MLLWDNEIITSMMTMCSLDRTSMAFCRSARGWFKRETLACVVNGLSSSNSVAKFSECRFSGSGDTKCTSSSGAQRICTSKTHLWKKNETRDVKGVSGPFLFFPFSFFPFPPIPFQCLFYFFSFSIPFFPLLSPLHSSLYLPFPSFRNWILNFS